MAVVDEFFKYSSSSGVLSLNFTARGDVRPGDDIVVYYDDDSTAPVSNSSESQTFQSSLSVSLTQNTGSPTFGTGYISFSGAVDYAYEAFDVRVSSQSTSSQVDLSDGVNFYWTNLGDNYVSAMGGDDVIYTGGGNDRVRGGAGGDYMNGGSGVDTLDYTDSTGGVVVDLGASTARGGYAQGDVILGFERALGTDFNDTLSGGTGTNLLKGYSGDDALYGDSGDDNLDGGSGKDRLEGQKGADLLTGGSSADTFLVRRLEDSTLQTAGRDTILDFSRAQGDKIHLSLIDANLFAGGDQKFTFIGREGFHFVAGELRYQVSGTTSFLFGDVDGDANADFAIQVNNVTALTSTDFVL